MSRIQRKLYRQPIEYQRFTYVMRPDNRCQVCLSAEVYSSKEIDRLVQCELCLSSIHKSHYGSQLSKTSPLRWNCERCRYLLNIPLDSEVPTISCEYCPLKSGIMKQIEFEKRRFWVHPECIIWDYPIRSFCSSTFQHVKKTGKSTSLSDRFWCRQFSNRKCKVCYSTAGQFVKCRYYNCETHYHVTCARAVGVVRELQRMREVKLGCTDQTEDSSYVYIPVYCTEHLQLRVKDFKEKAHREKNKDKQKHLQHLHQIFNNQLSQMFEAKQFEESIGKRYGIQFVPNQEQRSVEEESEDNTQRVVSQDQSAYDSELCEFLQRELQGCLSKDLPMRVVAQIDPTHPRYQRIQEMAQMELEEQRPKSNEVEVNEKDQQVSMELQERPDAQLQKKVGLIEDEEEEEIWRPKSKRHNQRIQPTSRKAAAQQRVVSFKSSSDRSDDKSSEMEAEES